MHNPFFILILIITNYMFTLIFSPQINVLLLSAFDRIRFHLSGDNFWTCLEGRKSIYLGYR